MKDKNPFFYRTEKGDFNLHLVHISNIKITHDPIKNGYIELQFDVHNYSQSLIKRLKMPDDKFCQKREYWFDGIISITDENEYLYEQGIFQIDMYHANAVSCCVSNDDIATLTISADKGVLGKDLY